MRAVTFVRRGALFRRPATQAYWPIDPDGPPYRPDLPCAACRRVRYPVEASRLPLAHRVRSCMTIFEGLCVLETTPHFHGAAPAGKGASATGVLIADKGPGGDGSKYVGRACEPQSHRLMTGTLFTTRETTTLARPRLQQLQFLGADARSFILLRNSCVFRPENVSGAGATPIPGS